MAWFNSIKDVLGVSIGLLAIVISLMTVLIGRHEQQASSFLAVQELMLSEELQRGRLLIYKAGVSGDIPAMDSGDYYRMVRSLAVFDLMGAYARKGIVRRRWVMDYWHPRLRVLRAGYEAVNFRSDGPYPNHERPDLLDLIARAERYRCSRECCSEVRNPHPPLAPTRTKGELCPGRGSSVRGRVDPGLAQQLPHRGRRDPDPERE